MRESGSREQLSTAQPSTAQSSSWWVGSVPSVGSGTLSSARAPRCNPPRPSGRSSGRGQPAFCRGCQRYGHLAEGCQDCVCRNCLGPGHQAKDCKNPRRCKACRGEGHMAHSCPGRAQSYATVLARGGSAALQPS
uniref:CCHC-type domain-containing protein n=1 Tax=Electrophorus electricus TaxID=8005 RepID=A0A4W4E3P1_ELEEL